VTCYQCPDDLAVEVISERKIYPAFKIRSLQCAGTSFFTPTGTSELVAVTLTDNTNQFTVGQATNGHQYLSVVGPGGGIATPGSVVLANSNLFASLPGDANTIYQFKLGSDVGATQFQVADYTGSPLLQILGNGEAYHSLPRSHSLLDDLPASS
jgi:hypothetical protein